MAGRRPKPTAVKRAQGNPGKRKLRTDEPTATTGTSPPKCLGKVGRSEWARVMKAAKDLGTITKLDRGELTNYCKWWEVFVDCAGIIDREGTVIPAKDGTCKPHPAIGVMDKASTQMHKAAIECGFTPASRSKLHGKPKPEENEFESFLSQGGIRAVK